MIFPILVKFAQEMGYEMILSSYQNHYPDITFISKKTQTKVALDLKSTYRVSTTKVNGMTLGAFTGYFRNRETNKNITFPYAEYSEHYILGVLYSRTDVYRAENSLKKINVPINESKRKLISKFFSNPTEDNFKSLIHNLDLSNLDRIQYTDDEIRKLLEACIVNEKETHKINELNNIRSVIRDIDFFVQEKWKIAIDKPGSGNTKNIGSTKEIDELINGRAIFTSYPNGKEMFNMYWKEYLTRDMAKAAELSGPPFKNLTDYVKYRNLNKE